MMKQYLALEPVNYDTIQLNRAKLKALRRKEKPPDNSPQSLLQLSISAVCQQRSKAVEEAVLSIPSHLAHMLLHKALTGVHPIAIGAIIANWPLPTLW